MYAYQFKDLGVQKIVNCFDKNQLVVLIKNCYIKKKKNVYGLITYNNVQVRYYICWLKQAHNLHRLISNIL